MAPKTCPRRGRPALSDTSASRRSGLGRALAVLALLVILVAGPRSVVAAEDERPLVVGTGNRVSGRVDVVLADDRAGPVAQAMSKLAEFAAARGLTLRIDARERVGREVPDASIVASTWPPADAAETAALAAWVRRGRGVLLVWGDAKAVGAELPEFESLDGTSALDWIDPSAPVPAGGTSQGPAVTALRRPDADGGVIVVPSAKDAAALALPVLRHAIRRGGAVRHLNAVFKSATAWPDGDGVAISAETQVPGEIVMDAVTVEGRTVLPEGPMRRIERGDVTDPQGTIVRLRFRGSGVTDETRLRFAAAVDAALVRADVLGVELPRADEPVSFRVVATGRRGDPAPQLPVAGTLGDARADGVTDATGTALLTFAADPARRDRSVPLNVSVCGPFAERRVETEVRFAEGSAAQGPARVAVQVDRPVHRPGGLLRFRAIALDATRRPSSGVPLAFEVRDPRDRVVATFHGRGDEFGVAAFELPLSPVLPHGLWTVFARAGETTVEGPDANGLDRGARPRPTVGRAEFRVDETDRAPFDLRVDLPDRRATPGAILRGTASAADWDGAALESVAIQIELADAGVERLEPPAPVAFEVRVPERLGASPPVLRVTGSHEGRVVSKEIPLLLDAQSAAAAAIEAPECARPGETIEVAFDAPQPCVADIDVVGSGRLLATTSVAAAAGRVQARVALPADWLGTADLRVTLRGAGAGGAPVRPLTICRAPLRVEVVAPADVRPGEAASARVGVRDADGAPVAAVLDVRGADRAYVAEAGWSDCDPRAGAQSHPALTSLGPDEGQTAAREFEVRWRLAAETAVAKAQADVAARGATDARTPWGTPFFAGASGGRTVLTAEGAVDRARIVVNASSAAGTSAAAELLPAEERHVATSSDACFARAAWLARHQSVDGSFHPVRFGDRCEGGACGGPGPAELHVAATSLATLDFLGAGETHQSGMYKRTVRDALRWLARQQRDDGFVGDRAAPCAALGHALAALALTEAYGMTQSVVLERPARRALAALAPLQRGDGSFGEAGHREGSVVLGTMAIMAWKSAVMSGIPFAPELGPRFVGWLDAHAEEATAAPPLSPEELAAYPFGREHGARTAAACAALARIFVGAKDPDAPLLRRGKAALLADLPRSGPDAGAEDPFSVWMGTLATFQLGSAASNAWNAAMKRCVVDSQHVDRDRCAQGSWDSDSPAYGRLLTTCFATLSLEIFYRYGRVFGAQSEPDPGIHVRRLFPDLFVSELALRTDAAGAAALDLRIPDQITTWELSVGAWDREGRYGRASPQLRSTLPLCVSASVPSHLLPGDVVRVPVVVRSTIDSACDVRLATSAEGGIEVVESVPERIHVGPGASVSARLTLRATAVGGGTVRVTAKGGGHSDALELASEVLPARPVRAVRAPVALGVPTKLSLPGAADSRAALRVSTGALGASRAGLSALLRRPTGCFEQTMATLQPALLAWRLLGARADDPGVAHLREGWQRILTFEHRDGGFSLYQDGEPRPDLTALGIDVLLDLDSVVPVDRAVLDRARRYLGTHLPDDPAARLFALGALKRLGADLPSLVPAVGDDPYLAALALTRGLLSGEEATRARKLLVEAVAARGNAPAVWHSKSRGLFTGAPAAPIEVTALAVEALARTGGNPELVRAGLRALRQATQADGTWGSTRATVSVLSALVAAEPAPASGKIVVERSGAPALVVPLGEGDAEVDLGPWSDKDSIVVRHEGTGTPWATLCVRGSGDSPVATITPLALGVAWSSSPVACGARSEIGVELTNGGVAAVNAPMVVLRVPGGFRVDPAELDRAARAAGFAFSEVAGGEVRLYAHSLAPGGACAVRLPLEAATAGTYAAGAATAYPYYQPEEEVSVAGGTVTIEAR